MELLLIIVMCSKCLRKSKKGIQLIMGLTWIENKQRDLYKSKMQSKLLTECVAYEPQSYVMYGESMMDAGMAEWITEWSIGMLPIAVLLGCTKVYSVMIMKQGAPLMDAFLRTHQHPCGWWVFHLFNQPYSNMPPVMYVAVSANEHFLGRQDQTSFHSTQGTNHRSK